MAVRRYDLRTIEVCLRILEAGSFRRAADLSSMRQSVVSRRVRELEVALGARLFRRSPSGVTPTDVGKRFLEVARRTLAELDRAADEARTGELHGPFTIGSYLTLHSGKLSEAIALFAAQNSKMKLRFVDDDRTALLAGLSSHKIDVVFLVDIEGASMSDCHIRLWREPIMLASAAAHRLADFSACDWCDVADEAFLVSHSGSGPDVRAGLEARFNAFGATPNVTEHDVARDGLLGLVAAGLGVTILAGSSVSVAPDGAVCVPIYESGKPLELAITACWDRSNDKPALVGFLDFLRERYAPLPPELAGSADGIR
ncbi:DNA-binding transcriptional regulator, LysR family [Rhizobiales bacterium GAS188]|nr:DNA-binding transcriptional regulator, LysR family [Rhizobiales bacterium GAS188]